MIFDLIKRIYSEGLFVKKYSLLFLFIMTLNVNQCSSYDLESPIMDVSSRSRLDQWIIDLQSNFNNSSWFLENLNDNHRKMIRQAMDFSIPREDIIKNILGGNAKSLATPIIPQNGDYYNNNLSLRSYNVTKALDLMETVFGYRFSNSDNTNTTAIDESKPYFPLKVLIPDNNPQRVQWANITSTEWRKIGINVTNIVTSWGEVMNRVFFPNVTRGLSYDNGGFDIVYIAMSQNLITPNINNLFHSNEIVPNGSNYIWLRSSLVNSLINTCMKDPNEMSRIQKFFSFQDWFKENVPKSILHQPYEVWGLDKNLNGFNPLLIWNYENWTISNLTNAKISIPSTLNDLNPVISNSYFDNYVIKGLFPGGLFIVNTQPSDPSYFDWYVRPYLASYWNVSTDGLTYNISLKSNLKWHDNDPLNASDVKFTYQSILTPAVGSPLYSSFAEILDNNSITILNETSVKIVLNQYHPFFKENFLTIPIIPQHLLDPSYGGPSYEDWDIDLFNKANGTSGPVGYGPYKLNEADLVSEKWSIRKWNNFNHTLMGTSDASLTDIEIAVNDELTSALMNLEVETTDFLDKNYGLTSFLSQLNSSTRSKPILYLGNQYQEIGYNLDSPIWGIKEYREFIEHSPIDINGNQEFHDKAHSEGWIGNGTAIYPYIIENLNISGNGSSPLMRISDIDLFFIINNSIMDGGTVGIILSNVSNCKISFSLISKNINLGIWLIKSHGVHITNNILFKNNGYGLQVDPTCSSNNVSWNDYISNNHNSQIKDDGTTNTIINNYYDDWQSPDANSDGIIDDPYVIDGEDQNSDPAPIDSPINPSPVHLLYPPKVVFPNIETSPLQGTVTIRWHHARDSYEYSVRYSLEISDDDGIFWTGLIDDLENNECSWNTKSVADGNEYLIKVIAFSYRIPSEEDTSDRPFKIDNIRDTTTTSTIVSKGSTFTTILIIAFGIAVLSGVAFLLKLVWRKK